MRVVPTVTALVSALALAGTALPAHAATPAVRIVKIFYDSPGPDRRTNGSLNAEYITLLNTGKRAVRLKGWTVRDKTGSTYRFGNVVLRAKKRLTLRTGRGADRDTHRGATVYWNRGRYVWNNDQDTAYLRDPKGREADSCSYKAGSDSASVTC